RRDHNVDVLVPRDANGSRNCGEVPADVLVGNEYPSRERARLPRQAVETLPTVKLVRKLAGARPEIAGAVDPRLRRRNEVRVGVDPLRIVRGQDMRLDAVRR